MVRWRPWWRWRLCNGDGERDDDVVGDGGGCVERQSSGREWCDGEDCKMEWKMSVGLVSGEEKSEKIQILLVV